jgi:hypothetical protein
MCATGKAKGLATRRLMLVLERFPTSNVYITDYKRHKGPPERQRYQKPAHESHQHGSVINTRHVLYACVAPITRLKHHYHLHHSCHVDVDIF